MAAYKKIKSDFTHTNQVLVITLNVPKSNIIDIEMMREIIDALKSAHQIRSLKAIVFQAKGEHFSYGASIPEHRKERVADMLQAFGDLFRTLIEIGKPTIAIVRGLCLGGGLEFAAFCNWIFASEEAQFGQPEIKLAVFPPFAALILPHRIGQSAADDLILTGRSVSALEAKQLGLVYSVSPDPDAEAATFIEKHILPKSAVALRYAARAVRFEMHRAFLNHIDEIEKMYTQDLMATQDASEGIAAFLEKRQPVWQNK